MKKHLKTAVASLILLSLGISAFAQQKISGTIIDQSGPVIGATVMIDGTSTGTVTDGNGNFTLSAPVNSKVSVSCIGYKGQSFTVAKGKVQYNLTLEEDAMYLDDVVVIGYQTVKRRDLTGAVASITGKEIAKMPVANAEQALQGKLPGVKVTTSSGIPGASPEIRVRGGNSITQSNEPLVLIDGVPGALSSIPSEQIESIDVLKDAASTAIYGARGANGVILVTTKGAKSQDRVVVSYSMYYQYSTLPKHYEVLSSQEYINWQWAYAESLGSNYGDNIAKYFGLGSKYGNHYADYANVPVHNSMNETIRPANSWNHNLSLSGGNDATNFVLSVNYNKNSGMRLKSGLNRYSANLKLNQKISKRLSANFDIRYTQRDVEGSTIKRDGRDYAADYSFRPILKPLGTGEAYLLGQGDIYADEKFNPVNIINNNESFTNNYAIRGTAALNWNIIEGLVARSEINLTRRWMRAELWNGGNGIAAEIYNHATIQNGHSTETRWTNTLNYTVRGLSDNHSLNFLLGHEMMTDTGVKTSMTGYNFSNDLTWTQALAMFETFDRTNSKNAFTNELTTPSNSLSFFGRANYSLLGRYLFTATMRADGSSKFAANNRWGYFPAAAFAWRISDEKWMDGAKGWMDELKLRASFGTSGSDGISSSLWKETWSSGSIVYDGQTLNTYTPASLFSNPDLKWETTISRNIGVDFSFFKTRLRGNVEFYWNTTKDLLMKMPIDATTGYSYQYQNVGRTSNRGFEISLSAGLVRTKNFQLQLNWNHSINYNNLDWIDPSANADKNTEWGASKVPSYDYIIKVGYPIGLVNGFIADGCGFYTVDDFDYVGGKYVLKEGVLDQTVANYSDPNIKNIIPAGQNAFPGAAKFKDVTGDKKIDQNDYTVIAEMQAHHFGGFNLQANWKGFDMSAYFSYQIGGYVYNARAMASVTMGSKDRSFGRNRLAYVKDCWKSYNVGSDGNLYLVTDPAELKALNANAKYSTYAYESGYVSSQFIEPGGFLRMTDITLGYTLPKKLTEKAKISNLRVYVTGSNLFVLTKYSGLDPEVGNATLTPGFDNGNYPKPMSITAGLNVTF